MVYGCMSVCVCRHKATGKLLCVANAHLCWDPRMPDLKAIQVRACACVCHQPPCVRCRCFPLTTPHVAIFAVQQMLLLLRAVRNVAAGFDRASAQSEVSPTLDSSGGASSWASVIAQVAPTVNGTTTTTVAATDAALGPGPVLTAATTPASMPIVLCGDFNSLAVKAAPDAYDRVDVFPAGGMKSGAYTLVTTGPSPLTHSPHQSRHSHSTPRTWCFFCCVVRVSQWVLMLCGVVRL